MASPHSNVTTMYDFAAQAIQKYARRKALGTRSFLGWVTPKIKQFATGKAAVQYLTFAETGEQVKQFGAALRGAGLKPAPLMTDLNAVKDPIRMAIFENTCAPWFVSALGAFSQSISIVTVYSTLGIDAVVEAVDDNAIRVMVCNKKTVQKLVERMNMGEMKSLNYLVYTNDLVGPKELIEWPNPPAGIRIISYEDFLASGDVTKYPPNPPKPSTCAVVMYTSGSTGKPKGVVITHEQLLSSCCTVSYQMEFRPAKEVYLAFLPSAHILEFAAEMELFGLGATLCFADPKSLSAKGASPVGALEAYSPTVMPAVPKIWDLLKKGVEAKIAASPAVAQFLVQTAFDWRRFLQPLYMDTVLFKVLVFKKLAAALGGRMTKALSGGGPLSGSVQDFIRTALDSTWWLDM